MANILTHPTNGAIYFDDGTAGSSSIPALTGNAVSLNHDGSAGLNIVSKNTTSTDRFTIDGDSGRLFSVNDSLTGTIFSVNDASGLPIVEVESTSSEDTITIGTYNTNALVVKGNLVGIGTASPSGKLDIVGDGADFFLQSADYKIARIQPRGTSGADLDKGLFSLFDGSTEDVRIDTAGSSWFNGGSVSFGSDVAVSGNLTAPTAGSSENSTKVATTAYVKGQSYITGSGIPTLSGSNSFTNSYNEFGNSTGSVSNDGSWNARLNLAGSSHARFDVKSVSDGIISTVYAHTGHAAGRFGTMSNHKIEFMTSGSTKATLNTDSTFYLGSDRVFADNYHPNADALTTGRTITLGGDLSGSAEFTGAADITITAAVSNNSHTHTIANITSLQSSLNAKAALASPALTGNPTAPTQSANNNSTRIATTAYVQTEITDLIGGAPGALDTLNELAAAINDDASYASTITTALGGKLGTTAKAADSNLLDGIDSSAFLRSNANDDFSGTLNYTPDTGTILSVDGQAVIQRMTANGALTIGHDDAVIIAGGDTSGILNSNINNAIETVFVGAEGGFVAYAFPSNNTAWSNRKELKWDGTNLSVLGYNVWHSNNDGSGSGLDADKLDGLQLNSDDRNDSANVVVRTQDNGYTYFGWINTTSGNNGTTAMDKIYASHDGFVRYYTPANFGAQIGSHISYNDLTNKPTAYSLPLSSSSTRGGVKIGFSESGKNYPVELDSSEKMFVNVPWVDTNTDTNTTYSAGTGLSLSGTTFSITDTISSAASNNTIVKRHSSGYIFANYFNTTPNTVSSGITQICVETGNDGYIRHGTAAAVRSFLNVASGATNVTNNNQLTNGAGYLTTSGKAADSDKLDGINSTSFARSDAADTFTQRMRFDNCNTNNHDNMAVSTQNLGGLEVYNNGSGNDAFMAFHVGGDFAVYFGLDADNNKLSVGGWSLGGNKYEIYHSGNKPSLATLGYTGATNANNYSLPLSSSSTRGGVKIGYPENGKYYPVELSSEKMYVHVPWTDTNTNTTYSAGTGISLSGTTFSLTDTASKLSLSGGTLTGTLNSRDIKLGSGYHLMRSNHHSGHLEGSYNNIGGNAAKSNPIYTIGSSYNPNDASLGNMYGIGFCDASASFISKTGASGWGMYAAADGDARVWLGGSNGVISSTGEHYVGSSRVFHDTYHPNADVLTTSRTIALGGDVTGSASFNGGSNITISASLASGSVGASEIAANAVGSSEIANDAVGAAEIAASAVGASELNVSGNGSSSQFLRSDGDGTFTWATPTDTNTNTTYSAGRGLDLSGTQFQLETDLRDSVSHIGYDSGDYIQWSVNSYFRSVVNGTERFRVNNDGIDVTGIATANTFRTDTANADYNLITRNNTSSTLYVQAATSASTQPILSCRYGSTSAGQGTEVLAVRRNSSYFANTKLGVGLTNPGSTLSVSGGVAIGASYASSSSPSNGMLIQGNVGIGTSSVSGYYALQVNGNIQGSYKSFVIDHPTKENTQLAHACIEGPEIGVYFRGKSTSDTIVVADYWDSLVDIDSMTVDLTAIGQGQDLFVSSIKENGDVVVGTNTDKPLNYYYVVYGERKDINKLVVEFEIEENDDEEESIAESPNVVDTDSVEYINP